MNLSTHRENRIAMPLCVDGSLDGFLSVHCYGIGMGEKARFQERFPSLPFASVDEWTGQILLWVWGSFPSTRAERFTPIVSLAPRNEITE